MSSRALFLIPVANISGIMIPLDVLLLTSGDSFSPFGTNSLLDPRVSGSVIRSESDASSFSSLAKRFSPCSICPWLISLVSTTCNTSSALWAAHAFHSFFVMLR